MANESKTAVYAALGGNLAIAVTKLLGSWATGSSAMLSEGIHSLVDTGNQVLLLVGMQRSRIPADSEHPFGHGKELYFWSLIVAVLIFGLGGGISVYEGIIHVRHPVIVESPGWNYVILAAALVFEGISLWIGLRAFRRASGTEHFWARLRTSKDPAMFTVIAEDSAAVMGLLIALVGIYCSQRFELPVLDGVASVTIGLLLAGVAVVLIQQTRGLLIGAGVSAESAGQIREIARSVRLVEAVAPPLTMYLGPDQLLLNLDVRFNPSTSARDLALAIRTIERRIRERFPKIRSIYIEANALSGIDESVSGPEWQPDEISGAPPSVGL